MGRVINRIGIVFRPDNSVVRPLHLLRWRRSARRKHHSKSGKRKKYDIMLFHTDSFDLQNLTLNYRPIIKFYHINTEK
jgi:hypothetical protein